MSAAFHKQSHNYDIPPCNEITISNVLLQYKHLFRSQPGARNPVRVPPRRIPGHYKEEVERQIQEMLQQGIIEESCSLWMAPAVFVRKKSGDIRLCVDYRELNKKTQKDTYPLPLPDEVQDKLATSVIFSTLDLQCRTRHGFISVQMYALWSDQSPRLLPENDKSNAPRPTICHCIY